MAEENINFVKQEKTKKILEEEHEVHNIFDGANEDEFTKRSRKAIRSNLNQYGMEDPEEELREESEKNILKKQEEEDDEELER